MPDTFQFQCQNCGHVAEQPQNPRKCPSCGETVMRPVELSEPESSNNSLETEEFDVDSALSELEEMTPSSSKETTRNISNSENQKRNRQQSQSGSSADQDEDGVFAWLKSLF